jgi:hypothetical protein
MAGNRRTNWQALAKKTGMNEPKRNAGKTIRCNLKQTQRPADIGSGWLRLALLLALTLLAGCGGRSTGIVPEQQRVTAKAEAAVSLVLARAPAFVLQNVQERHNRIGRVLVSGTRERAQIAIDPETPVIYADTRPFTTARGVYTNLVYRIHFPELPFSLLPFHLGAGKHVGLLVILTLDARQQVVLVTTAQTCGCYAVSIPTQSLPTSSYPDNWPTKPLAVFGERLPARLPAIGENDSLQVVIRPEVHRVMDIQVVAQPSLVPGTVRTAEVLALDALKKLPLADGSLTSLYYSDWPLTGHVKGAIKPWESLLLSLVSLDFFVGMDKEYGDTRESGTPFYTSLKPWNRSASDMNDFAGYLRFNGWKL